MSLQTDADRDFSSAKYTLALEEFANYIKYFHDYAYAPVAQYHIGEIYLRNEQWDDAANSLRHSRGAVSGKREDRGCGVLQSVLASERRP